VGSSLTTFLMHSFAPISLLLAVHPNPSQRITLPPQIDRVAGLAQSTNVSVLDRVPIWFEPNKGQLPNQVEFATRTKTYSLSLLRTGLVLRPFQRLDQNSQPGSKDISRVSSKATLLFVNANQNPKIIGLETLQSVSNYFNGSDPRRWRSRIANYSRVEYRDIYPGVDLICRGEQADPEFDWIVEPGADTQQILLSVQGANPEIDREGNLVLKMLDGKALLKKPTIFQEIDGIRHIVAGQFRLLRNNQVALKVEKFDRTRQLVIDPALVYSSYFGGSTDTEAAKVSVDSSGNIYVIGTTQANDLPLANPLQSNKTGFLETFVTKFDPSGSNLIYSTYLGGTAPGHVDNGNAIAVDASGNAYITGATNDLNFPTTPGAYLPAPGGTGLCGNCTDGWVAKLDTTGSSLLFSTYLTGNANNVNSVPTGIALDATGNAYLSGIAYPTGFPITPGAYTKTSGGALHVFITKVNASGSALVYSSYFGGNGNDQAFGIAVDSLGNAYVTGVTGSTDFPVTNRLKSQTEGIQAFVFKLNASGSQIVYSTVFGSAEAFGIAVDAAGSAYITGWANDPNFPTAGPMKTSYQDTDAFVSKLDPSGASLAYSIFLGGSNVDQGNAVAVDSDGNAYITGRTQSVDFPTINAIQPSYSGGTLCAYNCADVFVTVVSADGSRFLFSTYLGGTGFEVGNGIAVDSSGSIYVTGMTLSLYFPLAHPYQSVQKGNVQNGDASSFILKISGDVSITPQRLIFGPAPLGGFQRQGLGVPAAAQTLTFTNNTSSSIAFNTNTFMGANPQDFTATTDNCARSVVPPSGSCTITAVFNPADAGIRTAYLRLSNSSNYSPFEVSLMGFGSPIVFTPATLTFGLQTPGTTSAPQSLLITNGGQTSLTINSLTPGGDNPQLFPVQKDTCTGVTLTSMASCSVTIAFSPTFIGQITAALAVNDPASDSPQFVFFTGTGSAPQAVLSSNVLDFANQAVGTTSPSQSVTLTNSGNAPLIIAGIASTLNDFSQNSNCISPIAVGGTCSIQISFTPSVFGVRSGAIQISDNSIGSPQEIVLSGNDGVLQISPLQLVYVNQSVGTANSSQALGLSNVGPDALDITGISVTAGFSQTNNCTNAINTGGGCTINVTFIPTTAGPITGLLSIASTGAGGPQTVRLTGQGNDFALAISPPDANVMVGNPTTYTLTISPLGGAFNSTISMGCSSLARGMGCTFSPNSVTPGTSSAQLHLTISTTASSEIFLHESVRPSPFLPTSIIVIVISTLCLIIYYSNRFKIIGVLCFILAGMSLLFSCGGGSGAGVASTSGTAPGSYVITVTGTSGTLVHSQSINLSVQ
jgi:hypothetical protein